jgi:hypothetical protein
MSWLALLTQAFQANSITLVALPPVSTILTLLVEQPTELTLAFTLASGSLTLTID